MQVSAHVIASLSVSAAVWFWTKSIPAGVLCFLSGVCIDIDHLLEYAVHYGREKFTLMNIYRVCDRARREGTALIFKKVFLIFHSFELAILFWIGFVYTKSIYLLAIASGYSVHLIMDSLGNQLYPYSYFIFWRTLNNFNAYTLLREPLPR